MTRPSCFLRMMTVAIAATALAGCSVVAAPVRVTGDVVKPVPLAGPVVAAPLHGAADVID